MLPPLPKIEVIRHAAERLLAAKETLGLEELGLQLGAHVAQQLGTAPKPELLSSTRECRDRIYATLEHIEASSASEVRLGNLAQVAGLSPFHFLRLFKREVGVTPHRYVTQARVRRAISLLRDTSQSVTDIAYTVGFGDLSNFINTFRREVGCSPLRFRKGATASR